MARQAPPITRSAYPTAKKLDKKTQIREGQLTLIAVN
jgi:hypothetical protein